MKDRSHPPHWTVIGDGRAAVRCDGVEIVKRDPYSKHFVITDKWGVPLTQLIKRGPKRRERLFRHLHNALKAADEIWPLYSKRQTNIDLIRTLYGVDSAPGRQMLIETLVELGLDALTDAAIDRLASKQREFEQKTAEG